MRRLVVVDQKAIGRTPRSNLATYTGLFDHVRKIFAETKTARARRYDAGRFSFNVAKGRCEHCQGEGFVMVELLFLASVYTPCPSATARVTTPRRSKIKLPRQKHRRSARPDRGRRLGILRRRAGPVRRSLEVLRQVGLGYLRLGQPATELSGGEAQRIKLATELQRAGTGPDALRARRTHDGLHPADVEKLMAQLDGLVDAGNTVVVVEHDMHVAAQERLGDRHRPRRRRRGRANRGGGHAGGSFPRGEEPNGPLSGEVFGRTPLTQRSGATRVPTIACREQTSGPPCGWCR